MKPFTMFQAPGKWFKGNCHTHTSLSDGKYDPEATAAAYRKKGYDFLVLTDHYKPYANVEALSSKDFLVIRGMELHPPTGGPLSPHHLIAIGVKKAPPAAFKTARAAIRWGLKQGALFYYAHPYWSGHDINYLKEAREALGVEVYNATCDGFGLGYSEALWDQALCQGWRWAALAVDDAHMHGNDHFLGWIMLKAQRLDKVSILAAMKKRWFYASQGPIFKNISLRKDEVFLDCSPAAEIVWHANGYHGKRCFGKNGPAGIQTKSPTTQKASFKVHSPAIAYFRIMIRNKYGQKAWSNPIWRDPQSGRWSG